MLGLIATHRAKTLEPHDNHRCKQRPLPDNTRAPARSLLLARLDTDTGKLLLQRGTSSRDVAPC
jgi:hypothetical protein